MWLHSSWTPPLRLQANFFMEIHINKYPYFVGVCQPCVWHIYYKKQIGRTGWIRLVVLTPILLPICAIDDDKARPTSRSHKNHILPPHTLIITPFVPPVWQSTVGPDVTKQLNPKANDGQEITSWHSHHAAHSAICYIASTNWTCAPWWLCKSACSIYFSTIQCIMYNHLCVSISMMKSDFSSDYIRLLYTSSVSTILLFIRAVCVIDDDRAIHS